LSTDCPFSLAHSPYLIQAAPIPEGFNHIVTTFEIGSFRVTRIFGDGQFEALRGSLSGLNLEHILSNNKHVHEVESYIRTVKEITRELQSLLFKSFAPQLVINIVRTSVYWLNNLPAEEASQIH